MGSVDSGGLGAQELHNQVWGQNPFLEVVSGVEWGEALGRGTCHSHPVEL